MIANDKPSLSPAVDLFDTKLQPSLGHNPIVDSRNSYQNGYVYWNHAMNISLSKMHTKIYVFYSTFYKNYRELFEKRESFVKTTTIAIYEQFDVSSETVFWNLLENFRKQLKLHFELCFSGGCSDLTDMIHNGMLLCKRAAVAMKDGKDSL